MDSEESQVISFTEFKLEPRHRRLLRDGRSIPLNARAFDLLFFLTQNSGRIVSKDEILNTVWKDQFVEESNLAVQISAIRRALGDETKAPRFLATIPGKGYQFIADVSSSVVPSRLKGLTANETPHVFEHPDDTPALDERETRRPISLKRGLILTAGVSAVLLIIGLLAYRSNFVGPRTQVKSLAVLPFTNAPGDFDSAYLGDGLAESVIFSLSRISDFRVMSRDSAFHYRADSIDAKQVGKELGVDAVLRGRVLRFGDSISISVELVSTGDDSVIWGEKFTRKMSDAVKLQVDIAQSITRELKVKLSALDEQRLNESQTENQEAYQLYLIGRYHLNRLTDDGFLKGRDSFKQATERDPNYGLAYAGLADSYNMLSGWGAMAPNDGYPLAKAAALRALELDETLTEAHTSLGVVELFYDADWAGAEKELLRAIEINPSNSDAHMMYGHELMLKGRFDEARKFMTRAIEIDPLSIVKIVSLGNISYFERDQSKALETYQKAVSMDPNSGLAHWSLGNALLQAHRIDEAIAEYQKSIPLSGDSPDEPASLAFAFAISGNREGARKIIDDLSVDRGNTYVPQSLIASIYGALGETDKAFELLELAFRERDSLLVYLNVDPMFDPIRSDPRFPVLLKRVGFPQ